MIDNSYKRQALETALTARIHEVIDYEINIGNYERMIVVIENDYNGNEDLIRFAETLRDLLEGERRQHLRATIIRNVIADQLEEPG